MAEFETGQTPPIGGYLVDEGGIRRTASRSYANPTGSGNTEVVAAQGAGVRIRVLAVIVVSGSAITIKFQSSTTDISAGFPVAANGGFVMPENRHGWFQTAANEALNINLSGAATVGVQVTWVPTA